MDAMRDYVTAEERINIFPKTDIKRKFVIEELNNIFYRRSLDDERQSKLESVLHILKSQGK
jgi:hypothetical protein